MASEAERAAQKAANALGDLTGALKRDVSGTAGDVANEIGSAFGDLFSGVKGFFSGETEVGDMSPKQVQALQKALNMTAGYRGPMNGSTDLSTLGKMRDAIQAFAEAHPNEKAEKPVRGVDNNSDIAIDNDTLQDIISDANARAMNNETPYVEPPAAPPPPAKAKGNKR